MNSSEAGPLETSLKRRSRGQFYRLGDLTLGPTRLRGVGTWKHDHKAKVLGPPGFCVHVIYMYAQCSLSFINNVEGESDHVSR